VKSFGQPLCDDFVYYVDKAQWLVILCVLLQHLRPGHHRVICLLYITGCLSSGQRRPITTQHIRQAQRACQSC